MKIRRKKMLLPRFKYLRPQTKEEVCSLLSKYEEAKVIAGGTDILAQMKMRAITPPYLIGLKNIPNWDYIQCDGKGLKIGALTTLHSIENSSLIQKKLPLLAQVAHLMATPHIRRMGTIGGNLCNAAPSADTAPPLIALGAKLKVKSLGGERPIEVEELFIGPGKTILKKGEIVTEIEIPLLPPHSGGMYLKLPARTAVGIAAVGVAVMVTVDSRDDTCSDIRIVLGAVAPTPVRAVKGEEVLKGKKLQVGLIEKAAKISSEEAQPISDVRASAEYRREMVRVLTQRALQKVQEQIKSP
jgi:CO/xanthine dehydrogenase FAD-binding subunit